MELFVFIVAAAVILTGALGVVLRGNPVHAALSLVQTLFGVAVLFVAQEAHFLAAVQVIVYAGAIVVLFLFVIMLLGVDQAENLRVDPLKIQRPGALVVGVAALGALLAAVLVGNPITGAAGQGEPNAGGEGNVRALSRSLFSDYVFAFEVTSLLLVIAVVGTVLLARRPPRRSSDDEQELSS
ncbi:MAG TPA: NADH-quinone oxidoreductase subunit J [Acidimicrobiales bacterium]